MAGKKTPNKPKPADQAEVELLRALERSERTIGRLIGIQEDDVEQHNAGIKEAKADRTSILAAIDDYRNGVQALPLE